MFSKFLILLVLVAVVGYITAAAPKPTKKPVSSPSKKPVAAKTAKPSKAPNPPPTYRPTNVPTDNMKRIINTDFIPYPLNSYIPIKGPNGNTTFVINYILV